MNSGFVTAVKEGGERITSYSNRSLRQRVRSHLEVHGQWPAAKAAFAQPWRAVAARAPQSTALPAGIRIVDAPVEPLGVEAHGIRDAQHDHLAVLECDHAVVEIAS